MLTKQKLTDVTHETLLSILYFTKLSKALWMASSLLSSCIISLRMEAEQASHSFFIIVAGKNPELPSMDGRVVTLFFCWSRMALLHHAKRLIKGRTILVIVVTRTKKLGVLPSDSKRRQKSQAVAKDGIGAYLLEIPRQKQGALS
ncbi:hypothetical protein Nepgr_000042 [Nepenthes gracilis]|uniref:Uncharacterized protein n=1 Tax=Nepenthes gracilis TaxID=150966 RepID=A0AAD3RWG9_NEPGR|nr:hypothetical protein Nepgr_000042 [Nepenthes gracilis]